MRVRSKTLQQSHRSLGEAASAWSELSSQQSLRKYGFRNGVSHLLACGEARQAEEMLTDFAYCMARLKSESGPGARPLAQHAAAVPKPAAS